MKRTRSESLRLGVLFVLMVGFFLLVTARLVQLQVFKSGRYSKIVERQSTGKVSIPASRGMLYDRYGRLVAKNVAGSILYAYPHNERELHHVSGYLDRFYDLKPGTATKKYGLAVEKFRYITRRLSDGDAARIAAEAPRGLYIRQESRRAYPFGLVGKQILGFTDIDNKGQSGIELSYDSLLAGRNGWADIRRDGLRNTFRVKETALVKPVPGESVVLTVDWRLQETVEQALQAAVEKYNAQSGMAVFLDCRNGDILAMAHFDPQERNRQRPTKLRAVTDQFEPGSVIKAFTAAGLLDAGLVNFSDSIFCEEGAWRIGRRTLHDDKEHGWMNFRQIMELSSNIGIAKYALELGGENLFDTYRRFGLGYKTDCGVPGETGGTLRRPSRWSDYNIAALAIGHSVAVSPLQVAVGFAAIANGGDLVHPRLMLGTVDAEGYVRRVSESERSNRVINETSVDSLKAILRGVVECGTAMPVNSPTVAIAGKTGTAEIPDLKNKRYFKNRFMASFAGFFPYESPVIAGVVVLRDPHPITYGGHTAGPAFRQIAERYIVSNPDLFTVQERTLVAKASRLNNTVEAPDFIGRDVTLANEMARRRGIILRTSAAEGTVEWQYPPPDRLLLAGDEMLAAVRSATSEDLAMADLRGLSIRTASAFLHHARIKFAIQGNGRVVRQSIRPGVIVREGTVCQLECRPG